MSKTITLFADDICPELDADLLCKIQAAVRNVKVDSSSGLRPLTNGSRTLPRDWRRVYEHWAMRLFPHGWVYCGGRHIAVHASPPPDRSKSWTLTGDGAAGRCLFRIIEVPQKLSPRA